MLVGALSSLVQETYLILTLQMKGYFEKPCENVVSSYNLEWHGHPHLQFVPPNYISMTIDY